QIVATDISADALVTARINAEIHQLAERISFQQGHLLDALPANEQPFHLIVSNPPYVSAVEMDSLEIDLSFEPRSALTDEADGMSLIREMLESSPRWLYSKGSLIVETGPCGLPPSPLAFANPVTYADLAEKLRGGIYTLKS
ncbi:MAG: peptide chain release factor N(5)-glutamine methyltransferase, partial [Zetaproteobacteria bacterium CG02_land_8_20_14_3_00_50_9]